MFHFINLVTHALFIYLSLLCIRRKSSHFQGMSPDSENQKEVKKGEKRNLSDKNQLRLFSSGMMSIMDVKMFKYDLIAYDLLRLISGRS